jgi:RNA polymerase sigma-70 factor, ECF subfamily
MDNLTNKSDRELVALFDQGKRACDNAFKEIYRRHSSKLHAYCLKIVYNQQQAEDIFQETFIRFYQKVNTNYSKGSIAGFLITIARNLCLNYKRDKKQTVPFEDFYPLADTSQMDSKEETHKLISMAIDLLEFNYKEPLILRLYDGLNYNDISQICDISPENARKRVFRAKQKVRIILEPYLNEIYDK